MIAETHFWSPSITSQFQICPIPFHLDTYKGCVHDCAYCFGRDLTNFHRRRHPEYRFTDLSVNDPVAFGRWMKREMAKPADVERAVSVALSMRMPLKVGAIGDPCPPQERELHVTENCLRVLGEYNYPTEIQTKNPSVLADVLERLGSGHNLVVTVTLVSMDAEWTKRVERGAPSPAKRLEGIKRITSLGYPVLVKVQPAVWPLVQDELCAIVPAIKEAGAFGWNTEGLKIRVTMGAAEKAIFDAALPGTREMYGSKWGVKEMSDYVLREEFQSQYIALSEHLGYKHSLEYYSADNALMGRGDGPECCGTTVLRDYRVNTYNLRHAAFGKLEEDDPFADVTVNFTRQAVGSDKPQKTVREVIDGELEKQRRAADQLVMEV